MQNKNQYGLIYLHNYKSVSQQRDSRSQERTLEKTLNRNFKKNTKKVSLVFLSTFMQAENSALHQTSLRQVGEQSRDSPSPEPVLITNQFAFAQKIAKKKDQVLSYFETKMKKVQSQERSIPKLMEHVQREHSHRRQIKTLSQTLQRNRTFTTMPVPVRENMIKKIENIKEMGIAFKEFVAKKNKKPSTAVLEKESQEVFFNVDRKQLLNKANQTANLYSQVKDSKIRNRIHPTLRTAQMSTKIQRGVTEPIEMLSSKQGRSKQTTFKWTQLGANKISLKTTPPQ